jgi:hypothetical protein
MKIKRLSLRFNLDNETDRKAWERLLTVTDSKNKAIIMAISTYFEQGGNLTEVIRETIRDCLKDISVIQTAEVLPAEKISADEDELMDSLDLFL